jgi:hypothetical protein
MEVRIATTINGIESVEIIFFCPRANLPSEGLFALLILAGSLLYS